MKKIYVTPSMRERDVKVKCMMKEYSKAQTDTVGNMDGDASTTHDIWVNNDGLNSDNINIQF